MGIRMTIKDTDAVTLDELLSMLPDSKAAKEVALLKNTIAAASNYVANDEIYPTEVKFSNRRLVRIVTANGKQFLEVEWV